MANSQAASLPDYSKLPKVELHLHLDGACRLETLMDLARQANLNYPFDDKEQFKSYVAFTNPTPSLADFLKVFTTIGNILNSKEALERVAYEYCEDAKRQNILYFECRYNPIASSGVSPDDYIDGVMRGLERGVMDFGVKCKHILAFKREEPENVSRIVDLALKYKPRGVVGVDMAGNELLPLDQRHVDGFQRAKAHGLGVTVHAGESGPASNVLQAIEGMGATRIGHGYHAVDNPTVYQIAKERNIHFEACPISSKYTSSQTFENHALKRWASDGVSFSINTDDPGVMLHDLNSNYVVVRDNLGLTQEQILKSVVDSVSAAFLAPDERDVLMIEARAAIETWKSAQAHSGQ